MKTRPFADCRYLIWGFSILWGYSQVIQVIHVLFSDVPSEINWNNPSSYWGNPIEMGPPMSLNIDIKYLLILLLCPWSNMCRCLMPPFATVTHVGAAQGSKDCGEMGQGQRRTNEDWMAQWGDESTFSLYQVHPSAKGVDEYLLNCHVACLGRCIWRRLTITLKMSVGPGWFKLLSCSGVDLASSRTDGRCSRPLPPQCIALEDIRAWCGVVLPAELACCSCAVAFTCFHNTLQ